MKRAIVYIRIQDDLPRCFWASLKKTRELWDGEIVLVAPQRELNYPMLDEYRVTKIPVTKYEGSEMLKDYSNNTFFDYAGWNGFWDLTCKRHIYYYLVMADLELDQAIHMETDVVPYISLDTMFKEFYEHYRNKLCFTQYQEYQLSAHFLYCSDKSVLCKYGIDMIEYFKRGQDHFKEKWAGQVILAENHFAYEFWKENQDICGIIPSAPLEKDSGTIGFLIDPQAYGMWLSGTRFGPGKRYAASTHHIGKMFLAGLLDVHFSYDENGKISTPYVHCIKSGESYPIGAIHFNSKEPEQWI